ncbi:MAG TPA: hypothetical protein VFJ89_14405 [Nocardioides sp.]|jgi:hypothetical protein|nr:hypothetical protein [Nocardioides sp.]
MTTMSRAAAVAALTTLALAASTAGSQAAGRDWKTLSTFDGGKIQACKVATTDTGPWKIKLRVDATKATGKVNGTAFVTKNDNPDGDHWKSGWVAKGKISDVGTVTLPRGKAYALGAGIGSTDAGNGGSFTAGDIRGC